MTHPVIYRMRRTQALALVLALALLTLNAASCSSDPYRTALRGSDDVSRTVASAITVTTEYYSTGKLNDSEKIQIANYLNTVTDANMKFRHAVIDTHATATAGAAQYVSLAQNFVNAVPTDPTAFRYQSPDAQAKFATVLGAVKAALNGIGLAIQNAKAKGVS